MAIGRFADRRVGIWLEELESVWLGLAYDNPDLAGAYASEVFGGSYTRQLVALTLAENRAVFNVTPVLFTGLPAVRVTHIVGWDAQYNGNYEFQIPIDNPVHLPTGASFPIPEGYLALSFS